MQRGGGSPRGTGSGLEQTPHQLEAGSLGHKAAVFSLERKDVVPSWDALSSTSDHPPEHHCCFPGFAVLCLSGTRGRFCRLTTGVGGSCLSLLLAWKK